jgi:exosortase/archaeosortase family protein
MKTKGFGIVWRGTALDRKQKKLWHFLIFLIRLTLLSIPVYIILWSDFILLPLQALTASNTAFILSSMGFGVKVHNLLISIGDASPFTFFIGPDCTAWKSLLAFFALVFAPPGFKMSRRLKGLAVGFPAIYAGNILRIILVVLIERNFGNEAAVVFHDWLWQAGLIALVLLLWLCWLRWGAIGPWAGRKKLRPGIKKGTTARSAKLSQDKHIIKGKEK